MVIIFNLLSGAAFAALLLCAAVIDCRKQVIPVVLCILMIVPAVIRIVSGAMLPLDAVLGLMVGVIPWAVCYKLRPGSIGGGDIELMGGAGLVLGLLGALIMTFLSCAFYLGAYLLRKKKEGGIPFGPYITAGGIIAFLLIR